MTRPTTTVVIIDTESYALARRALERTLEVFEADAVLVFSDDAAAWAPHAVTAIAPIRALADYNRILIEGLPNLLTTDFALVIQFDGFALNGDKFTDDFYGFDYIGAPWPEWMIGAGVPKVGNGGFSLRSRRLIEAAARRAEGLDFERAEDKIICRDLRTVLEADGVAFAPLDTARRFSIEHDRSVAVTPFGFHGTHLLPLVYARDELPWLIDALPRRCFTADYQLHNLRIGFRELGPEAQALLEARVAREAAS
jgi:hypothetical protein